MKILYLTTAMKDEDYNALLNQGYLLNNPSNQNFHSKLIKALSLANEVTIISLVPVPAEVLAKFDSDPYHYISINNSAFNRLFQRRQKIIKMATFLFKSPVDIVVSDFLNLKIGQASLTLGKKFKAPVVAVMTDNPENLAKVHPIYVSAAKKALKGSTALLTLSSGLLTALDATEKPHFIFPGIVEKMPEGKPLFTPRSYFYFGGALLRRYGIEDLLKAYLACLPDYDLILAGHESMDDSLNHLLHSNPRIHFLGQVTKEENYNLEKNAALLINPRPFDSKLDQESIPSKLLEYLESSAPIVSTPHTFLQKEFPNDINWLKGSGESVLTDFLKSHLDAEKKLTGILPNEAAEKLYATYGVEAVGTSLQSFLSSLKA